MNMGYEKNYYKILHVQPDAPVAIIRSSYRAMMQKLKMHPDLGGDHENAALVNEAYAVLTNPHARTKYDASLKANSRAEKGEEASPVKETEYTKESASRVCTADNANCCAFCQTPHQLGKSIEHDSMCVE